MRANRGAALLLVLWLLLLMAGLMLADKTAAVEDENRQLKAKLAAFESRPAPQAERVEVQGTTMWLHSQGLDKPLRFVRTKP